MARKLLVGAIAAGALAVTAGTAFALTGNDTATTTSSAADLTTSLTPTTDSSSPTSDSSGTFAPDGAELSADDAANLVQARYGGTVHEVKREREHGRLEWKVEIAAADGKTYDVRVDALTGSVTRVDQDDDHDDD